MAHYLCGANGNLTSASTWCTVDSTALVTEGGASSTNLTTATLASANFAPGAITVDAIALKVNSRAAGTPTNTLTIELYDATSSSSVVSIAVPVADLPYSGGSAYNRGGWRLFSLGGSFALTAGKNYTIRLTLNSTSTAVAMMTNGTANNWQHMLRQTATAAPGANDFMWILGLWTASATWTQYTVTMDQTTTSTQYGTGSTVTTPTERSGLSVGKSTLTWPTGSSTAISLDGFLAALRDGIINIGTTASPITRGNTATVQFPVASGFGIVQHENSTVTVAGQSSTSSITRIWTTLVDDKSSASTGSLVVAHDTGWTSGSTIYLSTSRAVLSGPGQALTMDGNATSTSLPFSGSLTEDYYGSSTGYRYPSYIALTAPTEYNVTIQSDNASRYWTWYNGTGTAENPSNTSVVSWARFYRGIMDFSAVYGSVSISNLLIDFVLSSTATTYLFSCSGAISGTWSLSDIVGISGSNAVSFQFTATSSGDPSSISVGNIIGMASGTGGGFNVSNTNWAAMRNLHARKGSITLAYASGATSVPSDFLSGSSFIGMYTASGALQFPNNWVPAMTITNVAAVGGTNSIYPNLGYFDKVVFKNCAFHAGTNIVYGTFDSRIAWTFDQCEIGGCKEASQAPTWFWAIPSSQRSRIRLNMLGCVFSGSHTTQLSSGLALLQGVGAATSGTVDLEVAVNPGGFTSLPYGAYGSGSYFASGSYVAALDFNSIGDHRVWKPFTMNGVSGLTELPNIATDATTYRTAAPSERLTPKTTASKFESSLKRFAVTSGSTASVGVYAYRDAAYNGNPARLIIKQHNGAGYTADTVAATMSTSTGAWEQLTTTIAAVPRDCVLEVCVDCDGTTGSIYVDDWSAT